MVTRSTTRTYKTQKYRFLLYLIGLLILSFGISLVIKSGLGASPWDLLAIVLSDKTNIKIGSWSIVNQVLILLATSVIFCTKIKFSVIIPALIQGILMNLILSRINNLKVNPLILLLLGCALMALGLVIYTNQSFSANAIDNFTVTLRNEKKVSFGISKVITDLIPIILVMILGHRPTMFTILIYAIVPLFIFFYEKIWEQLSNILNMSV